jgi:hypothetical protein
MGAMKSSGAGLIGKIRETRSISEFMGSAAENYAGNPLVEGIIGALTGGSDEFKDLLDDAPDLGNLDLDSVLATVTEADGLLAGFGEVGTQFKLFLMDLVGKVVTASGSGLFGTGQKVSEQEAQYVSALRERLGL